MEKEMPEIKIDIDRYRAKGHRQSRRKNHQHSHHPQWRLKDRIWHPPDHLGRLLHAGIVRTVLACWDDVTHGPTISRKEKGDNYKVDNSLYK